MIAFLVGSGCYDFPHTTKKRVTTPYGEGDFLFGKGDGTHDDFIVLPRHGEDHRTLSSQINHLAHFSALKQEGVTEVISLSVVGALSPEVQLAKPLIPDDIFFPENRFPDGSICSVFQTPGKDRGHLIAGSLLHSQIQKDIFDIFPDAQKGGTYVHANGPRFNTQSEIKFFQSVGGTILSQTCGPEAVLANELEMAYGLMTFPIDYANGVLENPTPLDQLSKNLEKSKNAFHTVISHFTQLKKTYSFDNFVYRFAS